MSNRIFTVFATFGLGLTLAFAPACDKASEDKSADAKAKTDADKADDDKPAADKPAADKPAADKPSEVVEVAADARVSIVVDAGGYHPAEIQAPPKSKLTLVFTRTTEAGCGQTLVLAAMDVKQDLALNEAFEVEVEVPETGELGFACGMDMYKGKVVPKAES